VRRATRESGETRWGESGVWLDRRGPRSSAKTQRGTIAIASQRASGWAALLGWELYMTWYLARRTTSQSMSSSDASRKPSLSMAAITLCASSATIGRSWMCSYSGRAALAT